MTATHHLIVQKKMMPSATFHCMTCIQRIHTCACSNVSFHVVWVQGAMRDSVILEKRCNWHRHDVLVSCVCMDGGEWEESCRHYPCAWMVASGKSHAGTTRVHGWWRVGRVMQALPVCMDGGEWEESCRHCPAPAVRRVGRVMRALPGASSQ
jgi:hypothetical protein